MPAKGDFAKLKAVEARQYWSYANSEEIQTYIDPNFITSPR